MVNGKWGIVNGEWLMRNGRKGFMNSVNSYQALIKNNKNTETKFVLRSQ